MQPDFQDTLSRLKGLNKELARKDMSVSEFIDMYNQVFPESVPVEPNIQNTLNRKVYFIYPHTNSDEVRIKFFDDNEQEHIVYVTEGKFFSLMIPILKQSDYEFEVNNYYELVQKNDTYFLTTYNRVSSREEFSQISKDNVENLMRELVFLKDNDGELFKQTREGIVF